MITCEELKSNKIEPCPFCQGAATIAFTLDKSGRNACVECKTCGGRGPQFFVNFYDCGYDKRVLSAIEKWNIRMVK